MTQEQVVRGLAGNLGLGEAESATLKSLIGQMNTAQVPGSEAAGAFKNQNLPRETGETQAQAAQRLGDSFAMGRDKSATKKTWSQEEIIKNVLFGAQSKAMMGLTYQDMQRWTMHAGAFLQEKNQAPAEFVQQQLAAVSRHGQRAYQEPLDVRQTPDWIMGQIDLMNQWNPASGWLVPKFQPSKYYLDAQGRSVTSREKVTSAEALNRMLDLQLQGTRGNDWDPNQKDNQVKLTAEDTALILSRNPEELKKILPQIQGLSTEQLADPKARGALVGGIRKTYNETGGYENDFDLMSRIPAFGGMIRRVMSRRIDPLLKGQPNALLPDATGATLMAESEQVQSLLGVIGKNNRIAASDLAQQVGNIKGPVGALASRALNAVIGAIPNPTVDARTQELLAVSARMQQGIAQGQAPQPALSTANAAAAGRSAEDWQDLAGRTAMPEKFWASKLNLAAPGEHGSGWNFEGQVRDTLAAAGSGGGSSTLPVGAAAARGSVAHFKWQEEVMGPLEHTNMPSGGLLKAKDPSRGKGITLPGGRHIESKDLLAEEHFVKADVEYEPVPGHKATAPVGAYVDLSTRDRSIAWDYKPVPGLGGMSDAEAISYLSQNYGPQLAAIQQTSGVAGTQVYAVARDPHDESVPERTLQMPQAELDKYPLSQSMSNFAQRRTANAPARARLRRPLLRAASTRRLSPPLAIPMPSGRALRAVAPCRRPQVALGVAWAPGTAQAGARAVERASAVEMVDRVGAAAGVVAGKPGRPLPGTIWARSRRPASSWPSMATKSPRASSPPRS